jgi:uncharacterized repeat protein (TIGR03833 family)
VDDAGYDGSYERRDAPVARAHAAGGLSAGAQKRGAIRPGVRVAVVQKQDQPTGALTEGVVARLLTNSQQHPRGIKVLLTSGLVGRVQQILGSALDDA